ATAAAGAILTLRLRRIRTVALATISGGMNARRSPSRFPVAAELATIKLMPPIAAAMAIQVRVRTCSPRTSQARSAVTNGEGESTISVVATLVSERETM